MRDPACEALLHGSSEQKNTEEYITYGMHEDPAPALSHHGYNKTIGPNLGRCDLDFGLGWSWLVLVLVGLGWSWLVLVLVGLCWSLLVLLLVGLDWSWLV